MCGVGKRIANQDGGTNLSKQRSRKFKVTFRQCGLGQVTRREFHSGTSKRRDDQSLQGKGRIIWRSNSTIKPKDARSGSVRSFHFGCPRLTEGITVLCRATLQIVSCCMCVHYVGVATHQIFRNSLSTCFIQRDLRSTDNKYKRLAAMRGSCVSNRGLVLAVWDYLLPKDYVQRTYTL